VSLVLACCGGGVLIGISRLSRMAMMTMVNESIDERIGFFGLT
jgi:hypothetical protein